MQRLLVKRSCSKLRLHSNKTTKLMQKSIVKFIALSYRHCSTRFGHYNAHHQKPVKLPLQPRFHMNVEVEVFLDVVGLLV